MKDKAEGRTHSLELLLQEWVPREELIRLAHRHQSLKTKYSELITRGENIVNKDTLRK